MKEMAVVKKRKIKTYVIDSDDIQIFCLFCEKDFLNVLNNTLKKELGESYKGEFKLTYKTTIYEDLGE